jgi:hypothetical protein
MVMSTNLTTTADRIVYLRSRIEERRILAEGFRAKAIGAAVSDAEYSITMAKQCEDLAEGMSRALSILFP